MKKIGLIFLFVLAAAFPIKALAILGDPQVQPEMPINSDLMPEEGAPTPTNTPSPTLTPTPTDTPTPTATSTPEPIVTGEVTATPTTKEEDSGGDKEEKGEVMGSEEEEESKEGEGEEAEGIGVWQLATLILAAGIVGAVIMALLKDRGEKEGILQEEKKKKAKEEEKEDDDE